MIELKLSKVKPEWPLSGPHWKLITARITIGARKKSTRTAVGRDMKRERGAARG